MYYESWRDSCAQAKRQGRARYTVHTLVSKDRLSSEVFRVAKNRAALRAFRLLLLLFLGVYAGSTRRRGFGRTPLCVCVCVWLLVTPGQARVESESKRSRR